MDELLKNRQIGPLQGFRSKMGRPFAAILRIVRDEDIHNFKLEFDFGQDQTDGEEGEGVDFTGQTPLGPCPKCSGQVYEMGLAYVCEHTVAKPKACDFRSSRIILQQEILPEQMAKLLNDGKTDLLPGFVSQRTRRAFKAFLVRGKDGKIGFEFEERKAKGRRIDAGVIKALPVNQRHHRSHDRGDDEQQREIARQRGRNHAQPARHRPARRQKRDLLIHPAL